MPAIALVEMVGVEPTFRLLVAPSSTERREARHPLIQ